MKFIGKTVAITGGASGQGRAAATLFAEEGANVALIDIHEDNLNSAVHEIDASHKGSAAAFTADIAKEADVKDAMDRIADTFGTIDILINCAGKTGPAGKETMEQLSSGEWEEILNVNLIGPWLCIKYAVPLMRKAGGGTIINVSSTAGVRAIPGASPYCASKAALSMLTKTAALEFIPYGIRVNGVLPGHIDTPMMAAVIKSMEESGVTDAFSRVHGGSNPLKRLGTAEEVARVILFLAGDDSSFLVGTEIYVDGGFSAG